MVDASRDIANPVAFLNFHQRALGDRINKLECMRERIRLLEQDLRVGSASTEPGVSRLHGLPTGAQHPALPFEEHPRNAAAMNPAWQRGNTFTPRAPDAGPIARPWYEDHVGTQPSHALKENAAAITQAWKEGLIVRKAYVPFLTLSALTLGDTLDHY